MQRNIWKAFFAIDFEVVEEDDVFSISSADIGEAIRQTYITAIEDAIADVNDALSERYNMEINLS